MLELQLGFRRIHRNGAYPRLEDMGLIGDGTTAALVHLDGSIPWLCLPRFDSEPVFCGLLDAAKGGHFIVAPEDIVEARQYYELDTAVLHTEFRTTRGRVRVMDAMAVRAGADLTDDAPAGRAELVRSAVVLDGSVELRVELEPRGGGSVQPTAGGLHIRPSRQPSLNLHLRANHPLDSLRTSHHLDAGARLDLVLSWGGPQRHHRFDAESLLKNTADAWRRWMLSFQYDGPEADLVRRAAITLKLCDHWSSGSIVAAPTSSLPAPVGGVRNWDYRYTWVRDASFSVYALRRIGFDNEAGAFLGWVLDAFERGGRPRIMYDVEGDPVPHERQDPELEGYRRSAPVRWGNGAADQRQHDVYGEILDCAYQWVRGGGVLDRHLHASLAALADSAMHAWRQPDQGIWEVRGPAQHFTSSKVLCWVAADRGAKLAELRGDHDAAAKWRSAADEMHADICANGTDGRGVFCQHYDTTALDASALLIPLLGFLPPDDPRVRATVLAIADELTEDDLVLRYRVEEIDDGFEGEEGTFTICSFWLVSALAEIGELDRARALCSWLLSFASPLHLYAEEIHPKTGGHLGNFPQAFSHLALINAVMNVISADERTVSGS